MALYPKNKIPLKEVKKFIIIFYLVGITGFMLPYTKDFFIAITPLALIISSYLLAIYHEKYTVKGIALFLTIFILGFAIEAIGVKTGLIFGSYTYGKGLGIKLFDTPIIIGLNWLFLSYISVSIANSLKFKKWLTIIIAPLFMVIYDIILEQIAPGMNMWHWQDSTAPLKNYYAWYLIGLCFSLLLILSNIKLKNPLAAILYVCQFGFFAILYLFFV